ncbi:hypothetical protein D3C76_1233730 [compost metagenome]
MPMLALICSSCSATRNERDTRATWREARRWASSGSTSCTNNTNSSPPIRARVSWLRRSSRRRRATSRSNKSPMW